MPIASSTCALPGNGFAQTHDSYGDPGVLNFSLHSFRSVCTTNSQVSHCLVAIIPPRSSSILPLLYPRLTTLGNNSIPRTDLWLHGVVWLICSSRERWVWTVLLQLPWTLSHLQDLVLGRWLVDHVGHPGVPSWLDVCSVHSVSTLSRSFHPPRSPWKPSFPQGNRGRGPTVNLRVPLVFLEINPSCAQWKLLLHVLEVLVAETISADQGTGLGVTDVLDCC